MSYKLRLYHYDSLEPDFNNSFCQKFLYLENYLQQQMWLGNAAWNMNDPFEAEFKLVGYTPKEILDDPKKLQTNIVKQAKNMAPLEKNVSLF